MKFSMSRYRLLTFALVCCSVVITRKSRLLGGIRMINSGNPSTSNDFPATSPSRVLANKLVKSITAEAAANQVSEKSVAAKPKMMPAQKSTVLSFLLKNGSSI